MRKPHPGSQPTGSESEVLLEVQRLGNYVKVTAVDPVTLTEVSIMGPPSCGREILTRGAIRKLDYMLAKRAGPANRRGDRRM